MSIVIALIALIMAFQILWGLGEIILGFAMMGVGIAIYIIATIRDAVLAVLGKS